MPEIIIAEHAGFCFGVKRAISLAEEALKDGQKIFSMGPLIHNPQEVKRLEEKGLVLLKDENYLKEGHRVLIRSHGKSKGCQL